MNCIIVDDDLASRLLIQKLIERSGELHLVKSCESAFEAADVLKSEAIDLLFLDIQMPEMTGLELMDSLSEMPQIILITGKADFAVDAFKYDVTDYLVKPVSPARFLQAIEKAYKRFEQISHEVKSSDYLFIKDGTLIKKVPYNTILYIEALADYMMIYTTKSKHMVLTPMHAIEKKLPSDTFVRVHRSYIISLDWLEKIEDNTAIIMDKFIPVGNTFKSRLMKRINLI
ncbi:MAG: response regulator transcription factor [Bacteroidetes bacterium]|nr:response regulator transcription factor [Bacteroidota bacterium]